MSVADVALGNANYAVGLANSRGCYHGACFETCPCLCLRIPATLQALAHANVDLLAEEVALLASHGDSTGTSTALN